MNKYKGLTKEEAEIVLFKADSEGIGYCLLSGGYLEPLNGTDVEAIYQKAKISLEALDKELEDIREYFGIEEA